MEVDNLRLDEFFDELNNLGDADELEGEVDPALSSEQLLQAFDVMATGHEVLMEKRRSETAVLAKGIQELSDHYSKDRTDMTAHADNLRKTAREALDSVAAKDARIRELTKQVDDSRKSQYDLTQELKALEDEVRTAEERVKALEAELAKKGTSFEEANQKFIKRAEAVRRLADDRARLTDEKTALAEQVSELQRYRSIVEKWKKQGKDRASQPPRSHASSPAGQGISSGVALGAVTARPSTLPPSRAGPPDPFSPVNPSDKDEGVSLTALRLAIIVIAAAEGFLGNAAQVTVTTAGPAPISHRTWPRTRVSSHPSAPAAAPSGPAAAPSAPAAAPSGPHPEASGSTGSSSMAAPAPRPEPPTALPIRPDGSSGGALDPALANAEGGQPQNREPSANPEHPKSKSPRPKPDFLPEQKSPARSFTALGKQTEGTSPAIDLPHEDALMSEEPEAPEQSSPSFKAEDVPASPSAAMPPALPAPPVIPAPQVIAPPLEQTTTGEAAAPASSDSQPDGADSRPVSMTDDPEDDAGLPSSGLYANMGPFGSSGLSLFPDTITAPDPAPPGHQPLPEDLTAPFSSARAQMPLPQVHEFQTLAAAQFTGRQNVDIDSSDDDSSGARSPSSSTSSTGFFTHHRAKPPLASRFSSVSGVPTSTPWVQQQQDSDPENSQTENGEGMDVESRDGEQEDDEKEDGEKEDDEKEDGEKEDDEKEDAEKEDHEKEDAEKEDDEKEDAEKEDDEEEDAET